MSAAEAKSPPGPPTIYPCYVDKDEEWTNRVLRRFRPTESTGIPGLQFISPLETPLPPDWKVAMRRALARSTLAILFLSKAFLDSEASGLPRLKLLLQVQQEEGLPIIAVLLSTCPWQSDSRLKHLSALPADDLPLDTMEGGELEKALDLIADTVRRVVAAAPKEHPRIIQMASGTLRRIPVSGRQGELFGVPKLPDRYVPREKTLAAMKQKLFKGRTAGPPFVVPQRSLLLRGKSGMGKTVLASAFAHDSEVRHAFPDGVYWLNMGQKVEVLVKQRQLGKALNLANADFKAVDRARFVLRDALQNHRILLILDNVQQGDPVSDFNILNDQSSLLITTPSHEIRPVPWDVAVDLQRPSELRAKEMLARYAGVAEEWESWLPSEAGKLADLCEYLPLALGLVGSLTGQQSRERIKPIAAWSDVLRLMRRANSDETLLGHTWPDVPARNAIHISANALPENSRTLFFRLSEFAERGEPDVPLPEIRRVWNLGESEALSAVNELAERNLLTFDPDTQIVTIHDLVADYLARGGPRGDKRPVEPALPRKDLLPTVCADTPDGKDQLDITRDVNAFAAVLASKQVQPPLCLGIFGDWGSGKTFFMNQLENRIKFLADETTKAQKSQESAYSAHIAQITFNAWHFVDANLWASLACSIFEGLDKHVTAPEDPGGTNVSVFQEVETAKHCRDQARRDTENAERSLAEVEELVVKLEHEREQKCVKIGDVWRDVVKESLNADKETKAKLDGAAKELGIAPLVDSIDELRDALGELGGLHHRLKVTWSSLLNGRYPWWQMVVLVALGCVSPVAGTWLISMLASSSIIPHLAGLVGQAFAVVGSVALTVKLAVYWGAKTMTWLQDSQSRVEKIYQAARGKKTEAEERLTGQLVELREREATARRALETAEETVKKAQQKLADLENVTDGRRMAEFIRERVRSSDYRSRLGIISTIRCDFQALSDLLTSPKNASDTTSAKTNDPRDRSAHKPKIDRIILYIDDLDRCPEDKVVEVLQAVHLLLYFRLFVVVIAVDSRWLVLSLEKQYVALQGSNGERAGGVVDRAAIMSTTPQNYLEKIIQIPFHLRQMDETGFERLVTSLLPKAERGATDAGEREPAPTGMLPTPEEPREPSAPEQGPRETEAEIDRITPDHEKHEPPAAQQEQEDRKGTIDLTPASLQLTEAEEEFIKHISKMVATPRSVKRLINIYCVIRAAVTQDELPFVLGRTRTPPEYQPILILLAVQTGFPLAAGCFFREILSCKIEQSWGDFVKSLSQSESPPAVLPDGPRDPSKQSEAEKSERLRLLKKLNKMSVLWDSGLGMALFRRRVDTVARFSFSRPGDVFDIAPWADGESSHDLEGD